MTDTDYERVLFEVESRGCKLDWTKEKFIETYKNHKTNIDIISICNHKTTVQYNNLLYKNTGITCKKCKYKESKKFIKTIDGHIQEYQVIKGFSNYYRDTFEFKISVEGCLADFAIRPINEEKNEWLPLQMKTNKSSSHGIYGFSINNNYKDMHVILYNIDENRTWIIDGNDIKIDKICIGINTSIYDKYEFGTNDLVPYFTKLYNTQPLCKIEDINTPISKSSQQEQEFKRLRKKLFTDMYFEYSEVDSRVFDCIINKTFKVQDKVITKHYMNKTNNKNEKREKPSYNVNLNRRNGRGMMPYRIGDNDFYWISLPDKSGAYIISEQHLYDHKVITQNNEEIIVNTIHFHPYDNEGFNKHGWMNEYLYFYENKEHMKKIYQLFNPSGKEEYKLDEIPPIIIKNTNLFNSYTKMIIHDLVTNIFNNIKKDQFDMTQFVKKIFTNVIKHNKLLCNKCDGVICEDNTTGICRICTYKDIFKSGSRRKVERPSYENLLEELNNSNYNRVGIKYGVSHSTIKKWVKMYEKYKD